MSIKLLLIGTAQDGPEASPILIDTIEQAYEVFGGWYSQYVTLTGSSTGFTSDYPPVSKIYTYVEEEGALIPYPLFNLSASGDSVTFDPTGEDVTLTIKYLKEKSATDLIHGFAEAVHAADVPVHLMRMPGGSGAKLDVPFGEATLNLYSHLAGARYNQARAFVATGAGDEPYLVPIPPAAKGWTRRYKLSNYTIKTLAMEIELDWNKGYSPIRAGFTGDESTPATEIASGYDELFTGGEDENPDAEAYIDLLSTIDLSGVKVVSILGKNYTELTDVFTGEFFSSLSYPTMFVQGVAPDSTLSPTAYAESVISGKLIDNWYISLIVGEGLYFHEPYGYCWSSLAPAYAALLAFTDTTTTRKSLGVQDIRPVFSECSITRLYDAGLVSATKSVSKSFVVASGVTSNPKAQVTSVIAYADTLLAIEPVLYSYIGTSAVDKEELTLKLHDALLEVRTVRDFSFTVDMTPGKIFVHIVLYVAGEVKSITFSVGVRTSA